MAIKSAEDFFLDELKDIYSAEKQAIRAYPKLTKAITTAELKEAFQTHLEETKGQVERLDRIFEILEKRAGGKTCAAMKGLVEEGSEVLEEIEKGPILDAALIASAQRMEHYEIAAYGTVAALAKAMGQDEIAQLLEETLQEEKNTDQKLTGISEGVNQEAIGGGEEEEEEDDEEFEDAETEDGGEDDEEEPAPAKKSAKSAGKKSSKKR